LQEGAAKWGAGAGAAHLVHGHFAPHQQLEEALAAFTGKPAALLFSTGYMANLGTVQALAGKGDTVFADKLNHASLNDAMLLSRADTQRYRHGDMGQLAALLARTRSGRKLVVTDAVFSMDGDLAPLPELLALCERHDAWLLVDWASRGRAPSRISASIRRVSSTWGRWAKQLVCSAPSSRRSRWSSIPW
jgi:8-amino-7-oxononanoate synthase